LSLYAPINNCVLNIAHSQVHRTVINKALGKAVNRICQV